MGVSPMSQVRPATTPNTLPLGALRPWLLIVLAAASGLLLFVSHPPVDLGPLAFVALVPLFAGLFRCPRPLFGAVMGLVCGAVFFGLLLSYITMFGLLPWVVLIVFQALFVALAGYLVAHLASCRAPVLQVLGAAAIWPVAEFLRAHVGPVSLSLGQLCYTQHDLPPMLQIASLLGPQSVSFLVALASAGLAAAITCGPDRILRARLVVGVYGVVLLAYLGGGITMSVGKRLLPAATEERLTTAVVQGNVPMHTPSTAEDVERSRYTYIRMTEGLLPGNDLIVWPESALPVTLNLRPEYLEPVQELAGQTESYMLVGALEDDEAGHRYNTAYLISPAGDIVDRYRKVDLLIFGEYVPGRDRFKFLQRYPIRSFDFTPGGQRNLLRVRGSRLGVLICYEGIFAGPVRELCRKGAEALIIITSDAWAEGSFEVLQHSATATLRAVEARKYLVRAATTGRSALISPWGEVIDYVPANTSGVTDGTIQPLTGMSLYHLWGDWPVLLILCALWVWAKASTQPQIDQERDWQPGGRCSDG